MNKKVTIACDEQGQYSVGEEPAQAAAPMPGTEGEAPTGPTMQPAESLDDALEKARALLSQGGEEQAESPKDFIEGFQGVRGAEPPTGGGYR